MPSLDVIRQANRNKEGKNAGKYSIVFANCNAAGAWVPRPKWKQYENAFDLIAQAKRAGQVDPPQLTRITFKGTIGCGPAKS